MLEKNEKKYYFDAHFHLADCIRDSRVKHGNDTEVHGNDTIDSLSLSGLTRQSIDIEWYACTCCHSQEEWEVTGKYLSLRHRERHCEAGQRQSGGLSLVSLRAAMLRRAQEPQNDCQGLKQDSSKPQIYLSYGLHPQSAGHIDIKANADFLQALLQENKLHAIGEAGFDYFNQDFRDQASTQEEMFNIQLSLALQYQLPMVIHCRKANEKLFEYSKQLKKLPAVLFHSFMGMPKEAQSLLDRGINGYFSFGKQVLNNNKKVLACISELPASVLLTETDAPWQFLKGEKFTQPREIQKVFQAFCQLRNTTQEDLQAIFYNNFFSLFSPKTVTKNS